MRGNSLVMASVETNDERNTRDFLMLQFQNNYRGMLYVNARLYNCILYHCILSQCIDINKQLD